jgi:hypothetical protein
MGETGRADETVVMKYRLLLPGHNVYDHMSKNLIRSELGKAAPVTVRGGP